MYYITEEKPDHIGTLYLDKVVVFSCGYLGLSMPMVIDFSEDLGGAAGYIDIEDEEIVVHVNADQSILEITRTIFHELVHAKQMLDGYFREGCGKEFPVWKGQPYVGTQYSDYPWEIEAYSLEEKMITNFLTE